MREIACRIESLAELKYAVIPTIALGLRVSANQPVSGVDLRCQIMIDVPGRAHSSVARSRLTQIHGETTGPDASPRPLLWAHASANVPAFDRQCSVDITAAVSFDFDVAVAKYFQGLEGEGVPLRLLFSGMIFYLDARDQLQIARIPWTTEASGELPLRLIRSLHDRYYPGQAWLRMPRATFGRLADYQHKAGLPSWEDALGRLLDAQEEVSRITDPAR